MGVFKATKNRKEEGAASSGGTFKATNQRSYNSAMVYEWERANKESASTLQSLTSKSQKNEYLSSDDLDTYSKALDNYIESSNSLRGITKSLGGALKDDDASWESTIASLKSSFDDTKEYWSRWKTEDAYKTAVTNYESKAKEIDALKNYDFDASKKEIDILERDLNSINYLEKQIAEINSENELLALAKAKGSKDAVVKMADNEKRIAILRSSLEDAYKQYNGKDALSSLISEKNALYNRAERYQRIGDLTSVADVNSANYDQNFSAYASSNNAFADDMIYKYINDIEGQRQRAEDAYGSGVSTVPSEGGASMVLLPKPEALNRNLKYLSEDEIALYNYYYNKQGKDAADEYIDLLQEDLNYRAAEEMFKSVEGDTGLEMIFGVAAGLDQFNTGIESLVSNKDYIPVSATQAYSSMVREDLADAGFTLPDWLGGSSIGQVAYDAITTTSNMLPSIMISAIPGVGSVAGAITLGASSAGHAKAEMLNLGYTRSQANWYGAMVGASEAGLQYLLGGITKLGGKASKGLTKLALEKVDNAIARVAITLGMGMASEGLEESLQTAIEPWLKSLATGVDFESASIDEVLYSGLLGAITSVLFEGVSSVAEEVGTKELGSTFKKSGAKNVTALANFGKQFADGTAANRLGNKVNENSSAYDIGRLLVESGSAVGEQNIADISSMLQRYGMSTVEANETAKWLIKAVDGGIFTKRQQKLLEDEPVVRVYQDLVGNTKNSVNQRNADYEALYELAREKSGATKTESEAAKASTQQAETAPTNENAPAKENEAQGKFEASETGKTTHNGSEVKVESVASVKNGNVMLKLNDGNVVNANDVEFSTDEEARLYEAVRDEKMDADTANDFVSAYRAAANVLSSPQSVMDYRAGFVEAQTYGRLGIPFEALARDGQYTSGLVGKQAQIAYNRGKVIGINNANAAQNAPKKTSAKKITYKEEIHVSNIKKSQAYKGLSETQKAGVDGMVAVYKSLGIDVYFFESPTNEKGKRIGKNGYFNPKDNSIHVDLYAGNDGRGLILFTAAHELTHYIKKNLPAKFKAFADMLFEKYEADGHSVAERLAAKRAKLEQNGRLRGLSEQQIIDLAYEEVVADACEAMLAKGDAFAELSAQVKAKDKGLWEAIKDFLANLVARIKNAYANLNPDSIEGDQVADMLETATELQKAWVEMLVEASDGNDIVEIDTSSESVAPIMNSERTWTESDYVIHRDQMAEKIATALGVSVKKAKSYIDDINSIAKMIADDRVRLDYEASSFGSAFVSNVEYGGSFDYTTLCKKRRIYTGTFTEIQKRLNDVALTPDDILKIRNLMIEEGIEATCGLCYVEGSRANMGKFAKEFIRLYKRDNPDAWIPNMADVNTPDGVEQMRINHPEAYDQYVYFWNHYGKLQDSDKALFASQQKPKLYEARKEYKGEILEQFKGDTTVEKKNRNGGIRMQSFSDFEIVHLIDTMQVIMDMSTVGLAGQAYTKVPEFAEAFGNTGLKINLSLIAKGVDENGNLIFDDREGMPHETAFNLRDKYSKNVGTIIVTFTDEQLYAAMADPRIDFIIPFHRSQWKKGQYGAMGLPKGTKDYTYMQNEKLIKQTYHEYQGRMVKDKATNYMPNKYWDFSMSGKENAEAYLKMCAENNKRPKFYKLLDYDGNGTYSLKEDGTTDGYWKLLIDFKMYDNDGVGSRQMPVTPTFNMEEARKMLDEYKGGHSKYPVASSVVDAFVAEYNEENGTRYSDRESYAPTFYSHMGKVIDDIKLDKMGSASILNHLKNRGVKAEEIKWSGIEAFLEGKKSVTKAELQEFVAGSQLVIEEKIEGVGESIHLEPISATIYGESNSVRVMRGNQVVDTMIWDEESELYESDALGESFADTDEIFDYYTNKGTTRWSEYKLDGGYNYRELVFKMPSSSYSNSAMRTHWGNDAEGVLAHARIQDFNVNGKKMLFIEEIQSDWHNEGHTEGYGDPKKAADLKLKALALDDENKAERRSLKEILAKHFEGKVDAPEAAALNILDFASTDRNNSIYVHFIRKYDIPIDLVLRINKLRKSRDEANSLHSEAYELEQGVPDAPFRTNYHEYVLKRLIREAAENGYDSIGWTTADIQSKRWSDEYAEGYRIEYDQDIPKFLRKYGKKWGATVGTAKTTEGYDVWSMDIPDSMTESVLYEGQVLYSDRVTDKKTLDFLENQEHITTYKSFVEIDGKLYSPMATKVKGDDGKYRLTNPSELGAWQQAEEKPDSIPKFHKSGYGYYVLKKDDGGTVTAAYNPYEHSSNLVLNDQFESAYQRPNLVTVECVIPKSEMTSGYKAKFAKDSVGYLDWKSGTVAGKLKGNKRKVYLSRWLKPVRILSDAEVASMYKDILGSDISVPFNVVTPQLRTELERVGVKIDYEGSPGYQYRESKKATDDGTKFSDRDTDSVSNRSLLANALESVAKEGEERNILRNYKTNVRLIEAEQAKLAKVKSDANALRFKKGRTAAETKQLEKLDAEAKAISTRINRYDSVLLKMEAMKPIKDIIAREKQKAYKRASEAGRKAMEKQKARTEESRSRQAIKADIQRSVKKMTKLFKSNKKDARSNVKDEMRGTIASTLALADLLFANEISNEDIVLAGVDVATEKESIALNEYRDLLEKRDSLVAEREAIHGNGNVTKEQGEKQDKRLAKIEEELKAIRSRLSALSGELSGVFERERIRINRSTVGAMINELSIGYKALEKSEFDYISNAYSTVLQSRLDVLATNLGGKTVRDMNHSELAELRDVLKMIEHMIRESNKLFVEGRKADLAETLDDMHNEVIGASVDRKELNPKADKVRNFVENFSWNNLRPVDAFARLGSQTFEQLFWDYIDGMGKAGVLVKEAGEVIANARKEYGYDKWDLSHVDKTYTTRDGYQFKPTLADKLSIYAYSQREQAMDHMVDGGFTFDTGADYTIEEKGKKKKLTRRKLSHTFRLTQEDIVKIISSLSNEQTAYVDAILPYLTSLGDKGNEVSLRLYGVKLFNEKVYFPLVSSKDYLNSTDQELGATKTMSSLVNWGAAKPTVPKANNPIVLRAFDDVVLEHIEQMSNYYGLTLPVENLRRVFDNVNRAEADAMPVSTKALIGDRFGIEAQKYFAQLITDLNGGVMSSGARGPLETLFSRAKGMMVSSNLSVVAQQYFAVARAMELVDPKYFTPFLHGEAKKTDMKQYDEMIKYAPIAIIKEMGGFDVGSRGRVKDYIGYEGTNKKSAEYVKKTIDDVASWGASQMDKLGWVTIWKAVKAEVASEQSLTPGTEEFYAACKKRFTEVITKTQVFDSVASRSGYMRSKRDFTKMATSFMGEPTVTVGRLYVALNNLARDIRNGNKDGIKSSAMHFVRTTLSVSAATVLSSLAKALVYAGRDDEEDEALLERWTRNFGEALADDINILNSLPYARDLMSLINGFDVERPDTTLLSDIISSVKRMLDGEITAEDSLGLIGSVGNLLGVPLKNLIREIKAAINVIGDLTDNVNPTNMGGAFVSGFTGNERNKSERLYDAVVYGDKQKIAVLTKGMTESEITSAIRSALRENDPRIAEAAMASLENNEAKRKSLTMEIEREKNFSSTIVRGAINNEIQYIKNKVNEAKRAKGTDKYDDIVQKLLDKYPQRFVDKILK